MTRSGETIGSPARGPMLLRDCEDQPMKGHSHSEIELVLGDITLQRVDAIVNAANSSLLGCGGVDGAIHRAGGPSIMAECETLGGCETGDAKATRAGRLPSRFVIHTVGPIWRGGDHRERELLASCYRRSLEVAARLGCSSVAFPSISTGVYGFPLSQAAPIALKTVAEDAQSDSPLQLVRFVLFDKQTYLAYELALSAVKGRSLTRP